MTIHWSFTANPSKNRLCVTMVGEGRCDDFPETQRQYFAALKGLRLNFDVVSDLSRGGPLDPVEQKRIARMGSLIEHAGVGSIVRIAPTAILRRQIERLIGPWPHIPVHCVESLSEAERILKAPDFKMVLSA